MSDSSADRNPVDQLAEEFAERYRRGERPPLTEYVEQYPQYADEIRELFPALVVMEQLKPAAADATGAFEDQPAPAEGRLPERLGDYCILREVGRGGMGVVYEAEQISLGRRVALKVLPPHALLNPTYLERFRREAKAAAKLHHTNIVPVFGVGEEAGVHFYAMQFIRGEALDRVLHDLRRLRNAPGGADLPTGGVPSERSVAQSLLAGQFAVLPTVRAGNPGGASDTTPLPSVEPRPSDSLSAAGTDAAYYRSVARVGLQVADALAYAHKQGVLHRDVKPSNLLLDAQGTVWITDFGLAKADGTDELTHTGDIVGTIRFMAPERFDGRSLPQSDVYGLGLTLYELLTLRPAFDDTNKARLIEKVLHDPAVSPRRLDPRVPRDLETVVLKSVAKDPSERYATAEEMAEDLRRYLADRPIRARRASQTERAWRWCRRNPAVASLLGSVLGLLVVIAVGGVVLSLLLNDALGQAQGDRNKAQDAEHQARLREADALVGQAHGIRYSRRSGQRFDALAALEKAAAIGRELDQPPEWFDRLRNEAIAALALPDVHITHSWGSLPPGTHGAEVSHDFELYARTNEHGACSIRRVADDTEVARLPAWGEHVVIHFAPGRLLGLYGEASGHFQLWDINGPEVTRRLDERHPVDHRTFSADGQSFALAHRDGSISVCEMSSGAYRRLAASGITRALMTCLHPAEPVLAAWSYLSRLLEVRDLRTGTILTSLTYPWPAGGAGGCAWSPDGRTLAVSPGDGGRIHLYSFDPATRSLHLAGVLRAPVAGGTAIFFNPVGDRLACRGWDSIVHLFDIHTGRLIFSTPPVPGTSETLRFDSSGQRLATVRGGTRQEQIGLWSVADGREFRALVHEGPEQHHGGYLLCAVHPGGRLAAQGFTGGAVLFDLETGRELAFVNTRGEASVHFDGTGNLLTNSSGGFFRWPVRPDPTGPGRLTVGPPERLAFHAGDRAIAASRDGGVIAQAMYAGYGMEQYAGGWVLHSNAPQPHWLEAGASMSWASVSPDGLWVAFGHHAARANVSHHVNVYEAATGRRVWQSPADGHLYCRFSQDGRWLVTENDGGRAYSVGTWEPRSQLGLGIPWDVSSDSRLVVMDTSDGVYRLAELATGRELARLEDPDQIHGAAVFTPDDTRLVVAAKDGLRVWDLRRIRAELVKLGLDWDAPSLPAAPKDRPEPLQVEVNMGNIREKAEADRLVASASRLAREQKHAEALAALRQAIKTDPSHAMAHNNLAWQLLVGPKELRDAKAAIPLARKAVELTPEQFHHLNTLGVALYRNGEFKEALSVLEKSLAAGKGEADAFDLFVLAMCHARLGDPTKAKDCFDRAVRWTEGQKNLDAQNAEELKAFRAEADAVLKGK